MDQVVDFFPVNTTLALVWLVDRNRALATTLIESLVPLELKVFDVDHQDAFGSGLSTDLRKAGHGTLGPHLPGQQRPPFYP